MLQNNSYPTFLAGSYQEASQALRSESVKSENSIADRIAKAFELTEEQKGYIASILAKEETENDRLSSLEKAIFCAASIAQKRDNVVDGTYTITSVTGNHRTIELFTCLDPNSDFFGKRTVRLLVGSNNETDYKNFGFFNSKTGIKVFAKARTKNLENIKVNPKEVDLQKVADYASSLLIKGEQGNAAKIGFTLRASKRCMVCGRKLTAPSSLDFSMGATCYDRVHQ